MKIAYVALALLFSSGVEAGTVNVCIANPSKDDWDWIWEHKTAIVVPSGTVFDYAGPFDGNIHDPQSTDGEALTAYFKRDQKHTFAIVSKGSVHLTRSKPCATIAAAVIKSDEWGWTQHPHFPIPGIYFQAYGVVRGGSLDTDFSNDADPFIAAAARGEVNAFIQSDLPDEVYLLPGG